jgi:hypothetical protein
MAVASAPPVCAALVPWFAAWHTPLVELCAGVPTTAAPLAPTAVDVCDAGAEPPGCGGVLGFDAPRSSDSDFCRMQLRAPPGQVSETDAVSTQKLGQLQPFIAVFSQECMGKLASFGPT